MNLVETERLRQQKTIAAVLSVPSRAGLSSVATAATLPGARQQIPIDPRTGFPDESAPSGGDVFLAGDVVGEKAVAP